MMMDEFYSLGFLVSRASVSLAKAINARLEHAGFDLPHSQFIVLRCLYYRDGVSQFDIANLLSKDAAAIKRTIDNLEKKEFVERHQVRNLKNSIHITVKGKQIMPKVLKIAEEVIGEALYGINTNKELLYTMLDKIHTNLENK